MLDENLPTFIFRPMPDHPSSAIVYFTRSGSDPTPEYVLRLAEPISKPACRGVYAAALTDPYNSNDVVYGEVAVTPEWQLPTLSAAELREQRERGGDTTAPTAKTPDAFTVQLYNPDQAVTVRWTPGSWNKTESWEFEMPIETFRTPSASRLDRQKQQGLPDAAAAGAGAGSSSSLPAADSGLAPVTPKNAFRWKRDGRLGNKDMTCYMVGQTVGLHRSKEPDITVALFKHGRDPAVTIYEPNLQRVDIQDRKGLDLVLLLGVQVIRDLYLVPRPDPFNMEGAAATPAAGGKRKNSRTTTAVPLPAAAGAASTMSAVPSTSSVPSSSTPSAAAIDAETKRLQVMLEREERERIRREQDEERRIKKMLEAEEREQRRRDAEVAKETERLRRLYGMQGQELPSSAPSAPSAPLAASAQQQQQQQQPPLPLRPVSAEPSSQAGSRWHVPGSGKKHGGFLSNPAASVSGFFSSSSGHRHSSSPGADLSSSNDRTRIQKKRSVQF